MTRQPLRASRRATPRMITPSCVDAVGETGGAMVAATRMPASVIDLDFVHDHCLPSSSTAHAHTRLPSTVSATPIDSRIT